VSSTRAMSVAGIPTHSSVLNGPTYICANTLGVSYSISTVFGATSYSWSVTAGASIASSSGPNCVVDFGPSWSGGILTVTTSNSCGSFSRNYSLFSTPAQPGGISGQGTALCNATGIVLHSSIMEVFVFLP